MRTDFHPSTPQSLVARGDQYPTCDFGLVIVDECHHICARSFSNALFTIGAQPQATGGMRRPSAEWSSRTRCPSAEWSSDVCLLGLSATPERKDGLTDCLHWCVTSPHKTS